MKKKYRANIIYTQKTNNNNMQIVHGNNYKKYENNIVINLATKTK